MSSDAESLDLLAIASFGLEAVVSRELAELGYPPGPAAFGRVPFAGDTEAICRANLRLRAAERVAIRVGQFAAPDFDALFEQTRSLPWERFVPADAAFPVRGRSWKSTLSSVPAGCVETVVKRLGGTAEEAVQPSCKFFSAGNEAPRALQG